MGFKDENVDGFAELHKFGRFQLFQYFLVCLPVVSVSMMHVNYIFVAEDVDHRCRVPECDSPNAKADLPVWWPNNVDGRCFRPVPNENYTSTSDTRTCTNNTFSEYVEKCDEWVYENNNSIASELNLGCQSWKLTLVGSVHNAGMFFSMSISGWIADKYGRKTATILCSAGGVVGVIKMFLTNYYLYLFVEFLESALSSGLYTVGVVLMLEVGGESKIVISSVIFAYAIYFGEICFALLAMGLKYWKYLILFTYAPMCLYILYVFILKESVRWQILNGKMSEVKNTLTHIAKMNRLKISESEITNISNEELAIKFDAVTQNEMENIHHAFASKEITIRLFVSSFCFFTSSFVYYGLAVHSVLLPGDKYTNFVLSALVSFPSDILALYVLNKYGRRISLQYTYVLLSIFLISSAFSPGHIPWLKVIFFLFGKIGSVICFTGVYTYCLELYPTSVRGTLLGIGSTVARLGCMLAPLTLLLKNDFAYLPSILFSLTAILSTLLLFLTPETKSLPMFDTIAQIENYKKNIDAETCKNGKINSSFNAS